MSVGKSSIAEGFQLKIPSRTTKISNAPAIIFNQLVVKHYFSPFAETSGLNVYETPRPACLRAFSSILPTLQHSTSAPFIATAGKRVTP